MFKEYSIKEIINAENIPIIKYQKVRLLEILMTILSVFGLCMLAYNATIGNRTTAIGIGVITGIMLGELLAVIITKRPNICFFIGKAFILFSFFIYLINGKDSGGDSIWFWFLIVPPFSIYVAGFFFGALECLWGQIILMVLLWTPLNENIITQSTLHLTKLPIIFFCVSLACIAISLQLTKYQLAQEYTKRNINEELIKVYELSSNDALTGLLNRESSKIKVNNFLSKHKTGTFYLIDLDNFKLINDTLGHIAGDDALKSFGKILTDVFPRDSIVTRLGGDEFTIFLPNMKSTTKIVEYANEILAAVPSICPNDTVSRIIGASIGIAMSPKNGRDFDALYENADKAQYLSKKNGKNRYNFYERYNATLSKPDVSVDIKTLKELIKGAQTHQGAFKLEYDGFSKIYQFLCRHIIRTNEDIQIAIFSIIVLDGNTPANPCLDEAMQLLNNVLKNSIRQNDLMMQFSSSQIASLLVDSDTYNGIKVAERIISKFNELISNSNVTATYQISKI